MVSTVLDCVAPPKLDMLHVRSRYSVRMTPRTQMRGPICAKYLKEFLM